MFKKIKNLINNEQGSSLVQVMVIAGLVSTFSVAVMQTSKNQSSMQQSIRYREIADKVYDQTKALLMNKRACAATLGQIAAFPAPETTFSSGVNLTAGVLADDSSSFYAINSQLSEYLRFASFRLTQYDDTKKVGLFQLEFQKVNSDGNQSAIFIGSSSILRELYVKFNVNSSGQIIDCYAINGTGDDNNSDGILDEIADIDQSPLREACENIGGSYSSQDGQCVMAEYQSALVKGNTNLDGTPEEMYTGYSHTLCAQMGSTYNTTTNTCNPRSQGMTCPTGEQIAGFDSDGNLVCKPL